MQSTLWTTTVAPASPAGTSRPASTRTSCVGAANGATAPSPTDVVLHLTRDVAVTYLRERYLTDTASSGHATNGEVNTSPTQTPGETPAELTDEVAARILDQVAARGYQVSLTRHEMTLPNPTNAGTDLDRRMVEAADRIHHSDGEVEIDEGAVVSYGDDNGAYVAAWVWVPYPRMAVAGPQGQPIAEATLCLRDMYDPELKAEAEATALEDAQPDTAPTWVDSPHPCTACE